MEKTFNLNFKGIKFRIDNDKTFVGKAINPEKCVNDIKIEDGKIYCTFEDKAVIAINDDLNLTPIKALIFLARINCDLYSKKEVTNALRKFIFNDLAIKRFKNNSEFAQLAKDVIEHKCNTYREMQEIKKNEIREISKNAKKFCCLASNAYQGTKNSYQNNCKN